MLVKDLQSILSFKDPEDIAFTIPETKTSAAILITEAIGVVYAIENSRPISGVDDFNMKFQFGVDTGGPWTDATKLATLPEEHQKDNQTIVEPNSGYIQTIGLVGETDDIFAANKYLRLAITVIALEGDTPITFTVIPVLQKTTLPARDWDPTPFPNDGRP